MNIIQADVVARIGEIYELKPSILHQRHFVKKGDRVPKEFIKAVLKNLPEKAHSVRFFPYRDDDGDGRLLVIWKEDKE